MLLPILRYFLVSYIKSYSSKGCPKIATSSCSRPHTISNSARMRDAKNRSCNNNSPKQFWHFTLMQQFTFRKAPWKSNFAQDSMESTNKNLCIIYIYIYIYIYKAFCAKEVVFKSNLVSGKSKVKLYWSEIWPVVVYCCETLVLKESIIQKVSVLEREMLRKISGPTKEVNGIWRIETDKDMGRWHCGRKGSWGCLRTWCWGEYLDLGGRGNGRMEEIA